jgi:hypothetical protein
MFDKERMEGEEGKEGEEEEEGVLRIRQTMIR